jgi:hypothetical protein
LFSFSFSFSFPFPFPFPSSLLSHLIINHDACLRAPRAATRTSRVAGSSHTVSQCEKSARYARTHQLTINERLHAFHELEFKTKLENSFCALFFCVKRACLTFPDCTPVCTTSKKRGVPVYNTSTFR